MNVRITSVPRGAAPLWVRKEWVGVILPLKDVCQPGEGAIEVTFDELTPQEPREFFTVPVKSALEELGKKSPAAANWFQDNLPSYWLNRDFSFGLDEGEEVSESEESTTT